MTNFPVARTIREAAGMRVDADGPIAVIRSPV
jgi:hypothetical protein